MAITIGDDQENVSTNVWSIRMFRSNAPASDNRSSVYDYLVYALGSVTDRQRVPGVAEYAYTLAPSGPLSAAALRETLPSVEAKHGEDEHGRVI
jgi:NADH dehydrogenase FAD-containing subunit